MSGLKQWWKRHVVQRVHAPKLLDQRDYRIENQIRIINRWFRLAQDRRDDNRILMGEVCGRIAEFKGALAQIPEVDIHASPRRHIQIALLTDRAPLRVERTTDPTMPPVETRMFAVEDYTAHLSLGLLIPEDYSTDEVRWVTTILLIDELAKYVASHNTNLLQSSR